MKKLKILLSCYTCCPGMGSEPGVGWNIARHMAKYHSIWVLTQTYFRPFIEKELAVNPIPQLKIVYYDIPKWTHQWWHQGIRGVQFHYYLWQLGVYRTALQLHREFSFDLSQHVTLGRYWSPSLFSLLPIPFIFGPVGGGESAPKSFLADFGLRGLIYELARDTARLFGERDPLVRATIRRASLILAPTTDTRARLQHLGGKDIRYFPGQTGMDEDEVATVNISLKHVVAKEFRFISVSRLLHWKGVHLGIRAFAKANIAHAQYWIIGDGPEQKRLKQLANNLNVSSRVRFFGNLPRSTTLLKLTDSHVLVHLSLHDFSPTVCLEAMAASCPIICLDIGGPSIQITKDTGMKIFAKNPRQVVNDVGEAMEQMVKNRTMCLNMGKAGRQQVVSEFSWTRKAELLDSLYWEIVQKGMTITNHTV